MSDDKHLYLIDGSGYIFRAYYAIRALSTSQGFPTNAIYGFTQMILKLEKEARPEYWAVVFDSKEPTFRDKMYEEYKANRKEPPDDLVPQFDYFPKVVKALNIPMLAKPGFEADDLIATVAQKAKTKGFKVTIISGDKDLMQLLGNGITMWDTMKDRHYDIPDVVKKFGVPPEKITDLFGLMGDSSDNIPGVPGIGPKTASKLIQEYETLENLLKNRDQLKGKIKENLQVHADKARLSKKLATLDGKMDLPFEENAFRHQPPDKEACHTLFRELEFSRLLSELTPHSSLSTEKYLLITEEGALRGLMKKIETHKEPLAIDLETTSLNVMQAKIVGFALSWAEGEAAYIPVGHTDPSVREQLDLETVRQALQPLLEDPKKAIIGQNIKYDLAILYRHGFKVNNITCDTMIASYLLNPQGPHNLDDLSQQHLDHRTIRYEEVTGKGAKQKSFAEVSLEAAKDYACEDADCTWQLAKKFVPLLEQEHLTELFNSLEMPLMEVLLKMELAGVSVDKAFLSGLSKTFAKKIAFLEKKIFDLADETFKINSPKQLGAVLFEKMKLPGSKKTKTGYSTNQSVLENLTGKHPIAGHILEYRSMTKLKSTYTDSLQELIEKETGRIHTSFNQTVAATGRLSSSDPNLQNIPIRSPEGREIRKAFIAPEGKLLLSADYSQIELRILAHFTQEGPLTEAFQKGEDVHRSTAAALYGTAPEEVTAEQRSLGKTINFAVLYGQSAFGLSGQLKIDVAEANEYIENYFNKFPKVKPFREKILGEAREKGFVSTLAGRRRFFPDLLSKNIHIRNNAERMAFNTVFQGSAADIIKKAMIAVDRGLENISPESKMIIQVHDELVFEVPSGEVEKVAAFVKEKMETAYVLSVPVIAECGIGRNWADAH